ncbi:MAG: BatA domain-containing protein, partial [Filomicrobium sp.]
MSFGALAFLSPWLLAGLAALPLIYWLLRTTPPMPQKILFPATRILADLENREKTPAKTPWWLLLLRLLAAALIILALAEPILNPERQTTLEGSGPLVIAVDNGWAAAPGWDNRKGMIDRLITTAEQQSRPVLILPTAGLTANTAKIEAPAAARTTARALVPLPFQP